MKLSLIEDKYRIARGGYSRMLDIRCRKCNSPLFFYQKDGPGNLRRLYLDRIIGLKKMKSFSVLKCNKCREILGTKYIYPKERRRAFRLYQDAVVKKVKRIKT